MRAVQRILAVIECFTPERRSLSIQEIAERIGLPKATAFRIVHSLEDEGYMVRLENLEYCLSFRFIRIAGLVKGTLDIRSLACPVMEKVKARTGETICIQAVSGQRRVCIDATTPARESPGVMHPGDKAPLLGGSSTKLLLAFMPPAEREPLLRDMVSVMKRSRSGVMAELDAVRKQGYAVSHGERHAGRSGIAAPIKDVNDQVRYCLTLSGPTAHVQQHERQFTGVLLEAAERISRRYGSAAH